MKVWQIKALRINCDFLNSIKRTVGWWARCFCLVYYNSYQPNLVLSRSASQPFPLIFLYTTKIRGRALSSYSIQYSQWCLGFIVESHAVGFVGVSLLFETECELGNVINLCPIG